MVNGLPYQRLFISGNTDTVPLRIPRKQASPRRQRKNALRTGFSVRPLGNGDYFGFMLDGDGRFLLGDFTVTHNSSLIIELFRSLAADKIKTLYVNAEQSKEALCEQHERLGKMDGKYQLILCESEWPAIVDALDKEEPVVAALDSLHAIERVEDDEGIGFATGHASAIGQIGRDIKKYVDRSRCAMFAVGHLNNDGTMAGGPNIRYMLDGKMMLTRGRNPQDPTRYLVNAGKNRHGGDGRRAKFKMMATGMVDCGPMPFGNDVEQETA